MHRLASACPYLAGCHPHAHAWAHHTGKGAGALGVLLVLVLIGMIYDFKTFGNG